jgi:hypothetical protein
VPIASSPEACALAGYPLAARARVVGSHINGDFAAVYVLTDEGADWLSVVERDEGVWTEVAAGDGGLMWVNTDDDADEDVDRGVLACAIPVDAPGDYLVSCADVRARISAEEPYVVAVLLGVVADDRPLVTRLRGDATATRCPE